MQGSKRVESRVEESFGAAEEAEMLAIELRRRNEIG